MFLLLGLAWAEPPPIDPALRSCAQQRCGERCIPWNQACPASVQHALTDMAEADRQRALAAALCGAPPAEPKPAAATVDQQILLSTAVGILCSAEQATNPEACRQDAQGLPTPVDVPRPSKCGELPPVQPAAAPGAPATTAAPRR